jgi:excisionase family DNA binding protein
MCRNLDPRLMHTKRLSAGGTIGGMPQAESNPDAPYTSGAAARFLEVSTDTIRKWVALGKLTATRTSTGTLLFRLADLQALAESRRRKRSHAA